MAVGYVGLIILSISLCCYAQDDAVVVKTISCYNCHSAEIQGYATPFTPNTNCADTFNTTGISTEAGPYCMKVKYNGEAVVRTPAAVCVEIQTQGLQIHCCTTENCNSSNSLAYSISTILLTTVLLTLLAWASILL